LAALATPPTADAIPAVTPTIENLRTCGVIYRIMRKAVDFSTAFLPDTTAVEISWI